MMYAWGAVQAFNGLGQPLDGTAIGNRYTFQGREYSWETGMYYFRSRWYDPVAGRWLSKDPIGIAGGLNQYVAFNSNPLNFVDPNGMFGVAGAAIGGGVGSIVGAGAALWRGDSILAGAAGGFVAGAIVGSGAAIVAAAVGAGTLTAGGAVGTMAVVGAAGSVAGNTTEQISGNMISGQTVESAIANVNAQEQTVAGVLGAASGAASGAGIVLNQAIIRASQQGNQMLARHMVSISEELMPSAPGSLPAMHAIQSRIAHAMGNHGLRAANVTAAGSATTLLGTEIGEELANLYNYK